MADVSESLKRTAKHLKVKLTHEGPGWSHEDMAALLDNIANRLTKLEQPESPHHGRTTKRR
jgi:hypothetical protein